MITQSELKELLDYNKDTGIFTWKKRTSNRIKVGSIAGNLHNKGYIELKVNGIRFLCHRLAWFYEYDELPTLIDHINGDKADNRLTNLRKATQQSNAYNSKLRSNNKSGVRCVSWDKVRNNWAVRVTVDNQLKYFGNYNDLETAKKVADGVRKLIHKDFYR